MSTVDRFRYVADVYVDGEPIAQLPITPDWDAAVQWAHFRALRRGSVPPLTRGSAAIIEPLWDPEHGEPRVEGFSVILEGSDEPRPARVVDPANVVAESTTGPQAHSNDKTRVTIPRTYLQDAVERSATRLVAEGKLADGQRFLYEVAAFRVAGPANTASAGQGFGNGAERYDVEEIPQTLPLGRASLADYTVAATHRGGGEKPGEDMPLFIPARVIAEAKELARRQPDIETGGLLIGRLYRDTRSPEVFAVVTAFVPARHTIADRSRLTFTADTWAAARAALDLRGQVEILLGWVHAHPWWCRSCPAERQRLCPLMQPFFSRDDIALHRTVFPAGYNVALLLSDLGEPDLRLDAFGWRHGTVVPRGYYVTGSPPNCEPPGADGILVANEHSEPATTWPKADVVSGSGCSAKEPAR